MQGIPSSLMLLSVAAIVSVAACTSTPQGAEPSPSIPIESLRIEGLHVDQPRAWAADGDNWSVRVSWSPLGVPVDHYTIRRDGLTLAEDLTEPTFVDDLVSPADRMIYEVFAVDALGETSKSAREGVRTGAPPVADALLDGIFEVRLAPSATANLAEEPSPWKGTYFFSALCRRPGCKVRWRDTGPKPIVLVLEARSARRFGRGHGNTSLDDCYNREATGTITMDLRVLSAEEAHGEWVARRAEGTLMEQGDPVAGCLTGNITWDVTLSRAP